MIGAGAVGAAFGNGFRTFHHQGAAGFSVSHEFTFLACRARLNRMLAVGVVGTAIEGAEAAALLDHFSLAAERAGDAGCLCCRALDEFAFRIIAAGDEGTESPDFFDECAPAVRAGLANFFVLGNK